jgi:uncharacterized protein YkwD
MKKISIIIIVAVLALVYLGFKVVNNNSNEKIEQQAKNNVQSEEVIGQKTTVLDLSSQNIKKIPEYVLEMDELKELNLSGNDLEGALPSEIERLKDLEKLDVSGNNMTGIPAEIGKLEKLEELDYSDNEITGLPLEIGNLKNLKEFDLSGNEYSEEDLDKIKKELPNLEVITEKTEEVKEEEAVEETEEKKKEETTKSEEPIIEEEKVIEVAEEEKVEEVSCDIGSLQSQFLCILNDYREQNGKSPLSYDSKMNTVALNHSKWMTSSGIFSHTGENDINFMDRCSNGSTSCKAENLAAGATSAEQLFNVWKDSVPHNKNMLGNYNRLGLGRDGKYYTAIFD